jgi:hypothetical protein
MIECKQSFGDSLVSRIRKIEGVEYVYGIVGGPFTIVLKIQARDREELGGDAEELVENMMNLGHVDLTTSLIVL